MDQFSKDKRQSLNIYVRAIVYLFTLDNTHATTYVAIYAFMYSPALCRVVFGVHHYTYIRTYVHS